MRILLLLSMFLLSPIASGGDLKLRISTLGYEDAQDGAGDRKETILRSIETLIIPGKKFSVSCRNSAEIIELRGASTQDKETDLKVSIRYKYIKITAEIMKAISQSDGELLEFLQGSGVQTTITLKPGDSYELGGITSVTSGVAGKSNAPKRFSANRIVVTLVDSDADGQRSAEPSGQLKSRQPGAFGIDMQRP